MATQHPDNACAPYWEKDGDGFVSTYEEIEECFSAFKDLGCEEFMWDWEGKFVEESVVERLFHDRFDFFRKHPLGKEKFLTFRIPNIWEEKGHSLTRAMMCILTADDIARHLGTHVPPLFEVILPMTRRAEQMIRMQRMFTRLAHFVAELFGHGTSLDHIHVMPLIEKVEDMFSCRRLLDRYADLHAKAYGRPPAYQRLHVARSDPALNSGMVAAVVAGKVAVSEFYRFGEERGIKVYPAIGVGTLPFRGSLSPERVDAFIREYGGVRTVYVQSAFRYDHRLDTVKRAVRRLNAQLPRTRPDRLDAAARREAAAICAAFAAPYRRTVERLAPMISRAAKDVPRRRERKQHIGLFGYSRSIGKKKLPRAIPFTAVLYTLGVPPELIGAGRGLDAAARAGLDVERYHRNLRDDLAYAGRFLDRRNLDLLAAKNAAWDAVRQDVALIERRLGLALGPDDAASREHERLASLALGRLRRGKRMGDLVVATGKLRKSLG